MRRIHQKIRWYNAYGDTIEVSWAVVENIRRNSSRSVIGEWVEKTLNGERRVLVQESVLFPNVWTIV